MFVFPEKRAIVSLIFILNGDVKQFSQILTSLIDMFLCEQKMASSVQETGYEDELFQYPVGPSFHCCICTNVIKDPVMCHNEHIFCRACITTHLMYSPTCPTCMQPLTVETLRQAPRALRNLLSELQIRCEFFDRGCGKFVQLGDLERHVADCGFAPAVCSNEGCQLVVNKQDLLHHETAVCELRRVKCHSCNDIRREMDTVKVNLAVIDETLRTNKENVKVEVKAVEENVLAKVELLQQQLNKQEENNRQLREDNVEIKQSLNAIMKQLERITQQMSNEVQAEEMKKGIAEGGGLEREPKVVVAGGAGLKSVETFSLATKTWTPLQPMKECRKEASTVVWNNQILVTGGANKSIEKLSLNAVQVDLSAHWETIPAELPARLSGHRSVVYNGQMIVIGGYDFDEVKYSDSITEISLVPPYTGKMLANMPERRYLHGVAIFGDKILIVGGKKKSARGCSVLRSVIMYDITKNKFNTLAPLPYVVHQMATVKWDDDNVMIMGGSDCNGQQLNKVLMYNIKTQKSFELPNMKYKRRACVAAVVGDTVIVMGGIGERDNRLKTVEGFRFDRNTWEELPPMHEARCWATAVVC